MTTYAVGDIQGCFKALQCLLKQVKFKPETDQLWLVGDLVNRGPESLQTLRFIHSLGEGAKVVLGNHDLHLLALRYTDRKMSAGDKLAEILEAPDCDELLTWLRHRPLLHHDHGKQ